MRATTLLVGGGPNFCLYDVIMNYMIASDLSLLDGVVPYNSLFLLMFFMYSFLGVLKLCSFVAIFFSISV